MSVLLALTSWVATSIIVTIMQFRMFYKIKKEVQNGNTRDGDKGWYFSILSVNFLLIYAILLGIDTYLATGTLELTVRTLIGKADHANVIIYLGLIAISIIGSIISSAFLLEFTPKPNRRKSEMGGAK